MTTPFAILKAVGNKHRFEIVKILMSGECNVSTINKIVKVSQPALSQHLAKLRNAGVVTGKRNQREIYYHLKDANIIRLIGIAEEMSSAA